jgi:hypothetical protein
MEKSGVSLEISGRHNFLLSTDGTLVISGPCELTLDPELVRELSSFFGLFLAQAIIRDAETMRVEEQQ